MKCPTCHYEADNSGFARVSTKIRPVHYFSRRSQVAQLSFVRQCPRCKHQFSEALIPMESNPINAQQSMQDASAAVATTAHASNPITAIYEYDTLEQRQAAQPYTALDVAHHHYYVTPVQQSTDMYAEPETSLCFNCQNVSVGTHCLFCSKPKAPYYESIELVVDEQPSLQQPQGRRRASVEVVPHAGQPTSPSLISQQPQASDGAFGEPVYPEVQCCGPTCDSAAQQHCGCCAVLCIPCWPTQVKDTLSTWWHQQLDMCMAILAGCGHSTARHYLRGDKPTCLACLSAALGRGLRERNIYNEIELSPAVASGMTTMNGLNMVQVTSVGFASDNEQASIHYDDKTPINRLGCCQYIYAWLACIGWRLPDWHRPSTWLGCVGGNRQAMIEWHNDPSHSRREVNGRMRVGQLLVDGMLTGAAVFLIANQLFLVPPPPIGAASEEQRQTTPLITPPPGNSSTAVTPTTTVITTTNSDNTVKTTSVTTPTSKVSVTTTGSSTVVSVSPNVTVSTQSIPTSQASSSSIKTTSAPTSSITDVVTLSTPQGNVTVSTSATTTQMTTPVSVTTTINPDCIICSAPFCIQDPNDTICAVCKTKKCQ